MLGVSGSECECLCFLIFFPILFSSCFSSSGAMARGPIQIWNEWAIQILVGLSFTLQIFLFLFARTSRRGPSAMLKILLWLAYLIADSTAVYVLRILLWLFFFICYGVHRFLHSRPSLNQWFATQAEARGILGALSPGASW